jgi:hypothetical protein
MGRPSEIYLKVDLSGPSLCSVRRPTVQVVEIPIMRCFRCAYTWRPSQLVVRICPRCKSQRWDLPKISQKLGRRNGLGVREVIGDHRADQGLCGARPSGLPIRLRHSGADRASSRASLRVRRSSVADPQEGQSPRAMAGSAGAPDAVDSSMHAPRSGGRLGVRARSTPANRTAVSTAPSSRARRPRAPSSLPPARQANPRNP